MVDTVNLVKPNRNTDNTNKKKPDTSSLKGELLSSQTHILSLVECIYISQYVKW
jgi:hypothetical protein